MKKLLLSCLTGLLTSTLVSAQIGDVDEKGYISDERGNIIGRASVNKYEYVAGFNSEFVVICDGSKSRPYLYVTDSRGKVYSGFYLSENDYVKNVTSNGIIVEDKNGRRYLYSFEGKVIRKL